nr:MAG TPA: hypothetical protein [Caudoviricetes sp.]
MGKLSLIINKICQSIAKISYIEIVLNDYRKHSL